MSEQTQTETDTSNTQLARELRPMPAPRQETILVAAAFREEGGIIVGILSPDDFARPYRVLAERLWAYWEQHKQPPGRTHLDDIFADLLAGEDPLYRRKLFAFVHTAEHLHFNPQYAVALAREVQRERAAIQMLLASSDAMTQNDTEAALAIMADGVAQVARQEHSQPAPLPTDLGALRQLFAKATDDEFSLDIPLLDKHHVVPKRASLLVWLGATSAGKSWALLHTAKAALRRGQRVLYVTLELSREETHHRLLQSIWGTTRYFASPWLPQRTVIKRDARDYVAEIIREEAPAPPTDISPAMLAIAARTTERLRIEHCSADKFKVEQLRAILARLRLAEKFEPDMVIVDYLGIMATSAEYFRIDLGRNAVRLRALAEEEDIAVVTAQQINRAGNSAKLVTRAHIAEDFSAICTADLILIINRVPEEEQRGLARIWVDKNRTGRQSFGVVITQDYGRGKFCLGETGYLQQDEYERLLKRLPHLPALEGWEDAGWEDAGAQEE